ncbi:MAG: AAA family ATPase, partial [Myxococcota bacterium]
MTGPHPLAWSHHGALQQMFQKLYVHNYRCLQNFELRLGSQPSVLLLGKNGSGKSTVRDALQILQSVARGTNRVGALVQAKDFYRKRTDEPMRIVADVVLQDQHYRYELALEYPPGFKELRVLEESLECEGQHIFSRQSAQVNLSEAEGVGFRIDWHVVALPLIQARSTHEPLALFRTWLARSLILAP